MIRPATTADAAAIAAIDNHYLVTTCEMFDEKAVTTEDLPSASVKPALLVCLG